MGLLKGGFGEVFDEAAVEAFAEAFIKGSAEAMTANWRGLCRVVTVALCLAASSVE